MVQIAPPQISFASGEIGPLLIERADYQRWQNGLALCRGFVPLPEGACTRGPGTRFMGYTRGSGVARLLPFTFSTGVSRMVELLGNAARFWTDAGPILSGGVPYEIASPYSEAQIFNLQRRQSADRIYLVDGEQAPRRLNRFGDTDWTFDVVPFEGGPLMPQNLDESRTLQASAASGSVVLTANFDAFVAGHVGSIWRLVELDQSDVAEWVGNSTISTGELRRAGGIVYEVVGFDGAAGTTGAVLPTHASGTQAAYSGGPQWEWVGDGNVGSVAPLVVNQPAVLGQRFHQVAADKTYELASFPAGTGNTGVNPPAQLEGRWKSAPGGPIWDVVNDGDGWVTITAVNSATEAVATVGKRLPSSVVAAPTYRWHEGAWSEYRGWPRAIAEADQRMIYAGTPSEPRTVWFTATGSRTVMAPGTNPDDAFAYGLAASRDRLDPIIWLERGTGGVHVGTTGAEMFIRSESSDTGLTPTTVGFDPTTSRGSAPIQPELVDGQPIFLGRTRRRIYSLRYSFAEDRREADDLARVAHHIFGSGIVCAAWQEHPHRILWCVLEGGELAGMNWYPEDQIVAFHRHPLAGGHAEWAAVLPDAEGREDRVWLIVRRTIDGVERRCIEQLARIWVDDADEDALPWHLFCALEGSGTEVTEIAGLAHLEGEAVWAWTDRGAMSGTVAGGVLALPAAVNRWVVGLDASADQRMRTLPANGAGARDGGSHGRQRRSNALGITCHRTAGGSVRAMGADHMGLVREGRSRPLVQPRTAGEIWGPPEIRDFTLDLPIDTGWGKRVQVEIRPDPAAPLTVLALATTADVSDN